MHINYIRNLPPDTVSFMAATGTPVASLHFSFKSRRVASSRPFENSLKVMSYKWVSHLSNSVDFLSCFFTLLNPINDESVEMNARHRSRYTMASCWAIILMKRDGRCPVCRPLRLRVGDMATSVTAGLYIGRRIKFRNDV